MIVSHKHKYIFLKTHKTGGTSLQIALSTSCGKNDIISKLHSQDRASLINANGKGEQNTLVPKHRYNKNDWFQFILRGRSQYFSEHLDSSYLKRWLGTEIWDSYYKFCFERDPFDKVLSYYYWRTRESKETLDYFLDTQLNDLSDFNMYSKFGVNCVDDVFLYENIDNSIAQLENMFGFDIPLKNIKAKSGYRKNKTPYIDVLSLEQLRKIAFFFRNEINQFYPEFNTYL